MMPDVAESTVLSPWYRVLEGIVPDPQFLWMMQTHNPAESTHPCPGLSHQPVLDEEHVGFTLPLNDA